MSRSRRLRVFGIPALILLLAAAGFAIVQQRENGGEASAADSTAAGDRAGKDEKEVVRVPVELAVAEPHDIPAFFQATGSLEARRNVELMAKAQGQITRIHHEEGEFVEQGQVLVEIEHDEEQILLEKAKVNLENAERELRRAEELSGKGLSAEREYENAKQARDLAFHERDLARIGLQDRIIRAPFPGQIAERSVELGQTISPGQPLFRLVDVSPLEVRLFLPEQVVRDLEVGQLVQIRPDIDPDRPLQGTVHQIAPVVDPATSTLKVTLRVQETPGTARVGSFVRARITTDVHVDVVSIPKRALVPEAGANYVFVAEGDSVRKVAVTTGYADDEFIEVLGGVALGDRVVEVGQGALRDGSKIRDLEAERAADSSRGDPSGAAGDGTLSASDDH